MTRRSLLTSLVGGIFAGSALATVFARRRYGRLAVAGHRAHIARTGEFLRVRIDGEDVTDRCVLAHDVRGYVVLNRLDADGRCYVDADRRRVARELRIGRVVMSPEVAGS